MNLGIGRPQPSARRITARYKWLALLALVAACESPMEPLVELPDGVYTLNMLGPRILSPLLTPSWMGWSPIAVDFLKRGDDLDVTLSTNDLVALGPVQLFEATDTSWVAQFSWSGIVDGTHYWEVEIRSGGRGCASAKAVNEDLGIGPGGDLTIQYASCLFVMR